MKTPKRKTQIAELQQFVSRFSANASKAKQATSRAKHIDKIQLDEVKASSRQTPFIRFDQEKQLFRNALVQMTNLSQVIWRQHFVLWPRRFSRSR